jgi:hypothetical protein
METIDSLSNEISLLSAGSISKRQACRALLVTLACVAAFIQMNSTKLKPVASSSTSTSQFKSGLPFLLLPNSTDATAENRVLGQLVNVTTLGENNPLRNCSITSQIRILRQNTQWLLQSIDSQGKDKSVGGDEYYVSYSDNVEYNSKSTEPHATAVAFITDSQDGTYLLDFVTTPMNPNPGNLTGSGILTVYFQYSCGIGRMYQPLKDSWNGGGSSMTSLSTETIEPPFRMFQPPLNHGIDLSVFNLTISFGDSLMGALVGRQSYRPNVLYHFNVARQLSTRMLPVFLRKLKNWHKYQLRDTNRSVALILGSSMWDILVPDNIQGPYFTDHLNATRQLVETVRQLYPTVTLFWKSPSAAHPHRVSLEECYRQTIKPDCLSRVRYMSNSRIDYLYHQQIRLMRDELRVPVLDVYEASYLSADRSMHGDGRHYDLPYNLMVLSWFYPTDNYTDS